MGLDQLFGRRRGLVRASECAERGAAIGGDREPGREQRRTSGTDERALVESGERRRVPQVPCPVQRGERPFGLERAECRATLGRLAVEHLDVDVVERSAERVRRPGSLDAQPGGTEQLSQRRHVDLQDVGDRVRRIVAPHRIDQAVDAHWSSDVQREHRQHSCLAWSTARHPARVALDGHRAEESYHRSRTHAPLLRTGGATDDGDTNGGPPIEYSDISQTRPRTDGGQCGWRRTTW